MSEPFVSVVIPVWRDVARVAAAAASASGEGAEVIAAAAWEDADAVAAHGEAGDRVRWLLAHLCAERWVNLEVVARAHPWGSRRR